MIRVIPESPSIVLRATHILLIRVDAAETAEWVLVPSGWLQRSVNVTVTLMEVLKGAVQEHVGDQFPLQVTQFRINTVWLVPTPGVWSEQPLDPGTQLVAFCRTDGDQAAEMIKDPACEKLIVASSALLDSELAIQAESEHSTLPALLERAKPQAASLNYIFTEYLWAAYGKDALRNAEEFEALVQFWQEPDLNVVARSTLLSSIYSALITGTVAPTHLNRFAIALFRLLDLPAAAPLHDNIVGTFLPNLLGLHTNVAVKVAVDVLKEHPEDRAKVEKILQSYSGGSSTAQLLEWLKTEE